jgi:trehalose synthase
MSNNPLNIQEFSNLGFCATLAAFSAAVLGVPDPHDMTPSEKSEVRGLHLLAATFNAMLPGVFAISGWDLVGALLVQPESLGSLLDDRDYRWMNRGAFDLMAADPSATASPGGLPRAQAIYGDLPEQLRDRDSFASVLKRMLRARRDDGIALSKLVSVPEVDSDGLVVVLLERPTGWIVSAVNFSRGPVADVICLPELSDKTARRIFSTDSEEPQSVQIEHGGDLSLDIGPIQAEVFVVE